MVALDTVLEQFDASKEKVRREIRDGFFNADGSLRITEAELRAWIADRAIDELKVVLQLSYILAGSAQVLSPHILVQVAEQMSDEARHFDILRSLVPAELRNRVDGKAAELPGVLAADPHWTRLKAAIDKGSPYAALVDINIVHEGYSAAAIEELKDIPFEDIRSAYAGIGADEEKHHDSGRELLLWLIGAAKAQTDEGRAAVDAVGDAHQRAVDGGAMAWSWPNQSAAEIVANAHERAVDGGAMAWSWP